MSRYVQSDHRGESAASRRAATHRWLTRAIEQITLSRTIDKSSLEVSEALRIRPDHLMALAFPGAGPSGDGRADVILSTEGWRRRLRIPARIECTTPASDHTGVVLRHPWRARRYESPFPVIEADILTRPTSESSTEMGLDGEYRPPLGLIGLVADRRIGARVAVSTSRVFLEDVVKAISSEVVAHRHAIQTAAVDSRIEKTSDDPGRRRSESRY